MELLVWPLSCGEVSLIVSLIVSTQYAPPQHAFLPLLVSGLPGVEERISVGFLKLDEHVLDKLPRYAQAYDVVILGDGDMSYANEILHEVVG